MAIATKLKGFDVLCSNLELDNFEEMEKSAKSIAKKLNSVYYNEDGDDTSHLYIVGSVGRQTAIKGSSDLDILFDLPVDTYKKFDAYESKGQSSLLNSRPGSRNNQLKNNYTSGLFHSFCLADLG